MTPPPKKPNLTLADIFHSRLAAMTTPPSQGRERGRLGLTKPPCTLTETAEQYATRRAEAVSAARVVFDAIAAHFGEHSAQEIFAEVARRRPGPKEKSRNPAFDAALLEHFDERAAAEPHLVKKLPGIIAAELKADADRGDINEMFVERVRSATAVAIEEHLRRQIKRRDLATAQRDELRRLTGGSVLGDL